MSGGGGGTYNRLSSSKNNNNNNNVIIPAGTKKIVESLREVVSNVTDAEIYAVLKDSNMDPNEAVNRLLSQDTFHEVKSKRDKKKENKDTPDTRPRGGANTIIHRAGRGGSERHLRGGGPSQYTPHDSGSLQVKPGFRNENGTSSTAGSTNNHRPSVNSDYKLAENKQSHALLVDSAFSSSQNDSGFQSSRMGVPGLVSMADVVKMGRPQNKAAVVQPCHDTNQPHGPASVRYGSHSLGNNTSMISETNWDTEVAPSHTFDPAEEWPSIEQPPAASMSSEVPADDEFYVDPSSLTLDGGNLHTKSKTGGMQVAEQGNVEALNGDNVISVSVASRSIQEDDSGASPLFDNNLYYRSHAKKFETKDVENDASALSGNMQQLRLENNDQREFPDEDKPSVIIPDHLQVYGQDCSHLSFGSFGPAMNPGFLEPFSSRPLKTDLDENSELVDGPPSGLSDARSPDYYGDVPIRSTTDESLRHRATVTPGSYDSTSVQQPEVLKEETVEASQESQYAFPSSVSGYSYESAQQLAAAFNNAQISSQIPNAAHFSNVMQAYSSSLPSNLLAASVQAGREHDLSYSPFPVTQPLPSKYTSTAAAINGPSLSMSEALRAAAISSAQPTQQTHVGADVATEPAHPQQLSVHPYSQPTLPMGHYANMIGYPYLPPSYTYMPSAFQQNFAGNSAYHQSLAAMLPQYKNGVSVSSMPQSASVASGYGFGGSNSAAGINFPLNQPTAPTASALGYEDLLNSQYKESNHLLSMQQQQQNDNSAMWVQQGAGSRTLSGVQGNTYYGFQGQNQQVGGFRQAQQQPSQQFGAPGYPNYYQSAMSLEHQQQQQQQNAREGSLAGSQGQLSKQSQQHLWQGSY